MSCLCALVEKVEGDVGEHVFLSPDQTPASGLHEKRRTAGVPCRQVIPAGSGATADCLIDSDGSLTRWLVGKHATVVVVRPDGFIYAAARNDQPPPPPTGFVA